MADENKYIKSIICSVFMLCLLAEYAVCSSLYIEDPVLTDSSDRIITISFSGNHRFRGEIQENFNIKNYATGTTEDFVLSRLRLDLNLQMYKKMTLHLQLQDAHVWGFSIPDSKLTGNNPMRDRLDINQFFVAYQAGPINLKIGRQQISYRDNRVFGPGNWGNTGRYVWDAAMLSLNNIYVQSDIIIGRYVLHNPDIWPNKAAKGPRAFAVYNTVKSLPIDLDLFYVLKNDNRGITQGETSIGNLTSHTLGFWFNGKYGNWNYNGLIAGQFGTSASDRIQSFGSVLSIGYDFPFDWKPGIQLQHIYGSGDKNPSDGKINTFDGIFSGADTKLYGWMNLFFWSNLKEYRINIFLNPWNSLTLISEYHYFTLSNESDAWYFPGSAQRRDVDGKSGVELGHEFDLAAKMKLFSFLEIQTGCGFFVPGKFIKSTGANPRAQWYFLESTVIF